LTMAYLISQYRHYGQSAEKYIIYLFEYYIILMNKKKENCTFIFYNNIIMTIQDHCVHHHGCFSIFEVLKCRRFNVKSFLFYLQMTIHYIHCSQPFFAVQCVLLKIICNILFRIFLLKILRLLQYIQIKSSIQSSQLFIYLYKVV